MEPVKVIKWRAADGEIYDTEERAVEADYRVWRNLVSDVFKAGGFLMKLSDPYTIQLIDFILNVNRDNKFVMTQYYSDDRLRDDQFTAIYAWRAKTEDQANMIISALKKHDVGIRYLIDTSEVRDAMISTLGRTMIVQKVIVPAAYAGVKSGYRIVSGIDDELVEFDIAYKKILKLLYENPLNNKGDENNEKL